MPKCNYCCKKNHILMECKFCKHSYCTNHLQYELHECANIADVKATYAKQNEERLFSQMCKRRKLEKI